MFAAITTALPSSIGYRFDADRLLDPERSRFRVAVTDRSSRPVR
jgi:hypothetical protein